MDKKDSPKDIVKEIFEKPKGARDKISTLFTHFKPTAKAPTLKKRKTTSLKELPAAIDIGTASIKILQLAEAQKGEIEIICIDKEGYHIDQKTPLIIAQKEALRKIIGRNKIGPDVLTAIPSKDTQIYNLTFPLISETELEEAVRWKIAQLKPFGLDTEGIVYDFIKWEGGAGSKPTQQKILLVCAPRRIIENRTSLLQEAGLKPAAIEVAPISIVNLDNFPKEKLVKDQIVISLDLGAVESALVISRNAILYFYRVIALTSQAMTKQIAQHCHLTEKEAEEIKIEYGFAFLGPQEAAQKPEDKPSMVYHSLISSLENLVVDIEHSFKYFSYQVLQSQITKFDRVVLSGGGANFRNLEYFLNLRLNVPVERINPFLFFKISEPLRLQKKDYLDAPCEFAVCAGLAIGPKIEQSRRINLLARETQRRNTLFTQYLQLSPAKIAVLISVFAIFLSGLQMARIGFYRWRKELITQEKEIKEAQVKLSRLQAEQLVLAKEETVLLERKAKLEGELNFLNQAIRKPEEFSRALAEVADLLPEEAWVTSLSYLEKKLNIIGSTSDINSIMRLVEVLKASNNFSDARFSYTQREPDAEVYNFEIIAQIRQ